MRRTLVLLVMAFSLSGCGMMTSGGLPTIIPTGNPITDVLVSAAVQEGAKVLAENVVPALMGDTGAAVAALMPRDAQPVTRSRRSPTLTYVGNWY